MLSAVSVDWNTTSFSLAYIAIKKISAAKHPIEVPFSDGTILRWQWRRGGGGHTKPLAFSACINKALRKIITLRKYTMVGGDFRLTLKIMQVGELKTPFQCYLDALFVN